MSTNFPGALDTLSNPAATDGLTGHASQHANANDAIEALQTKVGADELLDDSKEISRQLQDAIAALEVLAAEYQAQLDAEMAQQAQEQSARLRSLLIEAQLQAELLQQQVEELDVAYIMFMLAAHA